MDDTTNDQSRINSSTNIFNSATAQWGGTTFVRPTYPFLNWVPLDESANDVSSSVQKLQNEQLSNKTTSNVVIQQSKKTEDENLLIHTGYLEQSEHRSNYNQDVPLLSDKHITVETTEEFAAKSDIEILYMRSNVSQLHQFCEETLGKIRTPQAYTTFKTYISESVTDGAASYPMEREGNLVMAFVEEVVNDLRNFLDEQFRMFKGCRIIKTGSVYEKTKIGQPDEFDFMIEIPALSGDGPIQFSLFPPEEGTDIPGLVSCEIVDTDFFEDVCAHPLSELNPMIEGICSGADQTLGLNFLTCPIVKILLIRISRIIRNKLSDLLPRERRYQGLHLQPTVEKAMTYTLLWKGDEFPWLPVCIDFVLGIPLKKTDNLDIPVGSILHAIFHNHASRISCSLTEMAALQQFALSDGQNKCMRMLKHLKDRYTPIEYEFVGTRFEVNKCYTLSTYCVKNALFYLYRKYNEIPCAFSEKELPFRVVEALEILVECCRRRVLHSFFIPQCNLISTEGDDQEFKEEQLDLIAEDLEELIKSINCMGQNDQILKELHEHITRRDQPTQEIQNKLIFKQFLKELGQYAARGYKEDQLERLKAICVYLNDFSGCEFSITGNSEHISFIDKGEKVDIVEEMIKLHNEEMEEKRQKQQAEKQNSHNYDVTAV